MNTSLLYFKNYESQKHQYFNIGFLKTNILILNHSSCHRECSLIDIWTIVDPFDEKFHNFYICHYVWEVILFGGVNSLKTLSIHFKGPLSLISIQQGVAVTSFR